ncbi:MAG TPA: GFA family protein [Methylophilaceae bacterium]|nr:GFA family protein [Methylophilaceae bacterium]
MHYKGSYHCQRITFEVEVEPVPAMECNCSICSRNGYLLWFIPRGNLHILSGEDDLAIYTFGQHTIRHHFCRSCGSSLFGIAKPPGAESEMAAINIRCLEGIDLTSVERQPFDGRSL